MSPEDRRAMLVRRIGAILALPVDRRVTFGYGATGIHGFQVPVEVTVDGRSGCCINVSTVHPTPWQDAMLRGDGFAGARLSQHPDPDSANLRRRSYARDVRGATAEEIADIVDWIFVTAFEAPLDYAPDVILHGRWARLVARWTPLRLAGAVGAVMGVILIVLCVYIAILFASAP